MSKKQASTETLIWRAIAEALAGQPLDLNEMSERVYTNASGKLHIDLDGLIASAQTSENDDDSDPETSVNETETETPVDAPAEETVSEELSPSDVATPTSSATTTNTVSVLDLLTSRTPTVEHQPQQPADPLKMSGEEQGNHLANLMKEMV